jgi:hypothetical protein
LRVDKDEHISRLQDQAASREAQLQAEAEALSVELMGRIDSLQTELDGVLEFKQRRVSGCSAVVTETNPWAAAAVGFWCAAAAWATMPNYKVAHAVLDYAQQHWGLCSHAATTA